jgi:hypothetical protein
MLLFCLELRCMHSYYHLVPLVCCYCSVGYLSDSVDWVCFLVFYQLMGKYLALSADMVSGFKSFGEAPRLARKCGTHRSDNPIRAL